MLIRDKKTGRFVKSVEVDETPCIICGTLVKYSLTAKKRKYCSKACRIKGTTKYPSFWICKFCNKEFPKDDSSHVVKYCSRECFYKAQVGKKMPERFSEYRRNEFLNKNPMSNKDISEKVRRKNLGKKRTFEQRKNKSLLTKKGKDSPNWKGGNERDTFLVKIRKTFNYFYWRDQCLLRDGHTCQECGAFNVILHVHHIKNLYKIVDDNNIRSINEAIKCKELWDISNGVTLCSLCHNYRHYKIKNSTLINTFNLGLQSNPQNL